MSQWSRGQSQVRMMKKEEQTETGRGAAPPTWTSPLPPGQKTHKFNKREVDNIWYSENNFVSKYHILYCCIQITSKISLKLMYLENF